MIEALTLATSELWCIAPGCAAGVGLVRAEQPKRNAGLGRHALVELYGTLTKQSMVRYREQISYLATNQEVSEIILLVDSPGGTVSGVHDLALTVRAAAQHKRVVAVIEDMACSAALYAISGATEIVIGETAITGSIGVFNVVVDQSKLLERIGVEVIIIRSGEQKGAGVQGTRLTPGQLVELKRLVDVQARHFIAAVSKGRRMSIEKAAELADGRVFIGREAIAAGLADRVGIFEVVLAEAKAREVHFGIERLTGWAAMKRYDELVAAETKRLGFRTGCGGSVAFVESTYPQLTAEAKKQRK